MAMINEVVARQFHVADYGDPCPKMILCNLDSGLFTAGHIVLSLHEAVHQDCDADQLGASLEGLLAFLGQLGLLVDELAEQVNAADAAAAILAEREQAKRIGQVEQLDTAQSGLYDAIRLLGMVSEQSAGPSRELEKMDRIGLLAQSVIASATQAISAVDALRTSIVCSAQEADQR